VGGLPQGLRTALPVSRTRLAACFARTAPEEPRRSSHCQSFSAAHSLPNPGWTSNSTQSVSVPWGLLLGHAPPADKSHARTKTRLVWCCLLKLDGSTDARRLDGRPAVWEFYALSDRLESVLRRAVLPRRLWQLLRKFHYARRLSRVESRC
jgi:hypothetical protein